MIGFDYTDRVAPDALKAAGCAVVFRYVTRTDWPKSLRLPEARELRAAGIPIVANFESTANRMLGAAAAGHADALEARKHLDDLGAPQGLKIWFSADWDVSPSEVSNVLDYLHAAADALGGKALVGLYAGYRACRAAADAGFGIWQTAAWSGDANGVTQWDRRTAARQSVHQKYVGGVQVDVNEILDLPALNAWGGPNGTGGEVELTDNVVIDPGFAARYPRTAADGFKANASVPVATLLEGAAIRAVNNEHLLMDVSSKLDAVLAQPKPGVDITALATQIVAAIGEHLTVGVDVQAVADAVQTHLAQALSGHGVG